jgi:hypothetical protein
VTASRCCNSTSFALALAGWAADPRRERSIALAAAAFAGPLSFLQLDEVFTRPLRESDRYRDSFAGASRSLAEHGALGVIERLLG